MNKRIKPTDGSLEEKQTSKTKKAKESTAKSFDITPEFLEDLEDLFIAGVPARDNKGHSTVVNFRCRELQQDILSAIKEICPADWFKSKSELSRSIFAIGCRIALEILNKKKSPRINELNKMMRDLNLISRTARKAELEKEVSDLQTRVLKNGRTKDVFKLKQLEKEVKELI